MSDILRCKVIFSGKVIFAIRQVVFCQKAKFCGRDLKGGRGVACMRKANDDIPTFVGRYTFAEQMMIYRMNADNTSSTASGPPSTSRGRQGADSRGRRVACPAGKNVDNVFKDEMSKRISRAFAVTEGKVHLALPENCPYKASRYVLRGKTRYRFRRRNLDMFRKTKLDMLAPQAL